MNVLSAQQLFLNSIHDVSYLLILTLGSLLTILAALLGLRYGLSRAALWIYNGGLGEGVRHFGTPPWKGYKWYRSKKWNMEHTL